MAMTNTQPGKNRTSHGAMQDPARQGGVQDHPADARSSASVAPLRVDEVAPARSPHRERVQRRAQIDQTHAVNDPERQMTPRILVRSGWVPIVRSAQERLAVLGVELREAREKLGALRLHVPAPDVRRPDVQDVLLSAAWIASTTCDVCAAAGRLYREGALRDRCPEHAHTEFSDDTRLAPRTTDPHSAGKDAWTSEK